MEVTTDIGWAGLASSLVLIAIVVVLSLVQRLGHITGCRRVWEAMWAIAGRRGAAGRAGAAI